MNFTAERLLSLEFSCLNLLKCKALYFVCNAVCDLLFKLGSQRDLFMAPVYVYRTRGICVVALTVHNYVLDTVQYFLIKLVIKPRLHTLDLRKPDLRKTLDLRKIVATTYFLESLFKEDFGQSQNLS